MGLALLGVGTAFPWGKLLRMRHCTSPKPLVAGPRGRTDFVTLVHQHSGISTATWSIRRM